MPQRLRGSLEDLKGFFATGKEKLSGTAKKAGVRRTNDFIERAKDVDLSSADAETIPVIAMCVVARARNTAVSYSVLAYGDIREQKIVSAFKENGVDAEFWNLCENRFGYQDPKPTLLKLAMSLFAVYTCKDPLTAAPKQWKMFVQDGIL
ncbi:hypothetical protein [Lactobacillus delbrueckii]|uniref:hypothetical protein n=1 Tax=Lactobacillus delbrueckii TaxID=1584 RepID=UPI001F430838|nr:hypothetical protein [Lactobacillus delbrueckii]GHN40353.1 hypothetical protein ME795_16350 [Lactobacillus delbrueckii]